MTLQGRMLCGLVVALCSTMHAAAVHAETGYVVRYERFVRDDTGTRTEHQIGYVVEGKARSELGSSAVYLVQGGVVWMLDPVKRTATRMDVAKMTEQLQPTMEQTQALMHEAQQQMAQEMATLPPEQRQLVEQMMAQVGGPRADGAPDSSPLQPTGQRQVINGYPCEAYVSRSPNTNRTEWRTQQWPAALVDPEIKRIMESFRRLDERLKDAGVSLQVPEVEDPTGWDVQVEEEIYASPASTEVVFYDRTTFQEMEKRTDLSPELFTVPAGYRIEEMPAQELTPRE